MIKKFLPILIVIFSFNTNGQNYEWNKPIIVGNSCETVAIDSKGNKYFIGHFKKEQQELGLFSNEDIELIEYENYSYIVKTDSSNNIIWYKIISAQNYFFRDPLIAIDNNDNIVFTGIYDSPIKIDSLTYEPPEDGLGILIAKIDSDGNFLWNQVIGSEWYTISLSDLKFDDQNNLYIGGGGNGLINFYDTNNVIVESFGFSDSEPSQIFLAKYEDDGKLIWVRSFFNGGKRDDIQNSIEAIEIDKYYNIYLTGWWGGADGTFDTIPKQKYGADIFIAKIDSSRTLKWLKQIGGKSSAMFESGRDIIVDNNIECFYVTGGFHGSANFGNGYTDADDKNIFLAKYSFDGTLLWMKNFGAWSGSSSYIEMGSELLKDKDGFVYIGGSLGSDIFVAKYTEAGEIKWITYAGKPNENDEEINSLVLDYNNTVCAVGYVISGAKFGNYTLEATGSYNLGFFAEILQDKLTTNKVITKKTDEGFVDMYPSPTKDIINLKSNFNLNNSEVTILNSIGIIISKKRITNSQINVSDIKSGIYILIISTPYNQISTKFIKVNNY